MTDRQAAESETLKFPIRSAAYPGRIRPAPLFLTNNQQAYFYKNQTDQFLANPRMKTYLAAL